MEWIVTEARTVADAKEVALDQLGVDEREAEFEVLVEPQRGLLGLGRANAQVRARVMPRVETPPDRRGRSRRARGGDSRNDRPARSRQPSGKGSRRDGAGRPAKEQPGSKPPRESHRSNAGERRGASRTADGGPGRGNSGNNTDKAATSKAKGRGGTMQTNEPESRDGAVEPAHEEDLVTSFTERLAEAFGVDATVATGRAEDGALEVVVDGPEVGLLIGRRGMTLAAIEELLRVVVQRQAQGRRYSKVRLEVGGYRRRRREALENFARRIAEDVVASGESKILEPMNSADRKIVHDAIVEVSGVDTASEGEEPRRRVVVRPAD